MILEIPSEPQSALSNDLDFPNKARCMFSGKKKVLSSVT